jgi:hypothetical protein
MFLLRQTRLPAAGSERAARLLKPYAPSRGPNSGKSGRVILSPVFLRNDFYKKYFA